MLVWGAAFCVITLVTGRYFAFMTPERAAEIWKDNPAVQKEINLFGKITMISGPVIFGVLAWVALSGMVD